MFIFISIYYIIHLNPNSPTPISKLPPLIWMETIIINTIPYWPSNIIIKY